MGSSAAIFLACAAGAARLVFDDNYRAFIADDNPHLQALDAWQIEFCARVDSITNFQHSRAVGDDIEVASLVEDAPALPPGGLAEARAIALNETPARQ